MQCFIRIGKEEAVIKYDILFECQGGYKLKVHDMSDLSKKFPLLKEYLYEKFLNEAPNERLYDWTLIFEDDDMNAIYYPERKIILKTMSTEVFTSLSKVLSLNPCVASENMIIVFVQQEEYIVITYYKVYLDQIIPYRTYTQIGEINDIYSLIKYNEETFGTLIAYRLES